MCVYVCYICPLASVNACVLFSAWLPNVLAISLSWPRERAVSGCVSESKLQRMQRFRRSVLRQWQWFLAVTAHKPSRGQFSPFSGVGNPVIVMGGFWECLVPNITVKIQSLRLREEGKGRKRRCAGLRYYNEATTHTVKRETEASEPLMREFHICPKRYLPAAAIPLPCSVRKR